MVMNKKKRRKKNKTVDEKIFTKKKKHSKITTILFKLQFNSKIFNSKKIPKERGKFI